MSGGIEVNHNQLAAAGKQTEGKAAEAQGIQAKVAAADGQVPAQAWGKLGDLSIYRVYTSMFGTFKDHIADLIQGVEKLSDNIKATAEAYRQNESDTEDKFTDIVNDLNGAAKPPTPAGTGKAE